MYAGMRPLCLRPGDVFLTTGASGGVAVRDMNVVLQDLKDRGVVIGVLVYDTVFVTDPEYFDVRDMRVLLKRFVSALTFADFLLTTSEFNRASLIRHMADRSLPPLPVEVVPLAQALSSPALAPAAISPAIQEIARTPFVLCAGAIAPSRSLPTRPTDTSSSRARRRRGGGDRRDHADPAQ